MRELLTLQLDERVTRALLHQMGDDAVVGLCEIVHQVALASADWVGPEGEPDIRRAKRALRLLRMLDNPEMTLPLLDSLCVSYDFDIDEAITLAICTYGSALLEPVIARLEGLFEEQLRWDRSTALLWLLVETGVRDDRILDLIAYASVWDPYSCICMLGCYGDPVALGPLMQLIDENTVAKNPHIIDAAHNAINTLGGVLTAAQRDKVAHARIRVRTSDEN